jgi:hypothetical protein
MPEVFSKMIISNYPDDLLKTTVPRPKAIRAAGEEDLNIPDSITDELEFEDGVKVVAIVSARESPLRLTVQPEKIRIMNGSTPLSVEH